MIANVFTTVADFALWYNQTAEGKQTPIKADVIQIYFDLLKRQINDNYAHAESCICEQCRKKQDRRNQRGI